MALSVKEQAQANYKQNIGQYTQPKPATANTINQTVTNTNPSPPPAPPAPPTNIPAYGSNIANFDANNAQHIALANAGQEWAAAKASGDTAAMNAAAQKGRDIRAGLAGSTFNAQKGISTLGGEPTQAVLTTPKANQGLSATSIFTPGSYGGYDPTAQEKAYLEMQLASLSGQSEAARNAAMFGVDTNKAYLDEQLASLGEEQALARQNLLDQQNRFGGLYSGGVNYQGGMQDRSFGSARSGLTRDVASRNQQLLDQYGTQANAIAQQIQTLQFNQPDILKQRIQDWINNERDYGLNYANTFGNLLGQQTLASVNSDRDYALAQAGLTGNYQGQQTLAAQQQAFNQGQQGWENRFNYGQAVGQFQNGQQTLQNQQFQYQQERDKITDEVEKRNFDENVRQFGLNFALDKQRESRISSSGGSSGGSSGSTAKAPSVSTVMGNVNKLFGTYDNASRQYVVDPARYSDVVKYVSNLFPDDPKYDDVIDMILGSYNIQPGTGQQQDLFDRPVSGMLPSE